MIPSEREQIVEMHQLDTVFAPLSVARLNATARANAELALRKPRRDLSSASLISGSFYSFVRVWLDIFQTARIRVRFKLHLPCGMNPGMPVLTTSFSLCLV